MEKISCEVADDVMRRAKVHFGAQQQNAAIEILERAVAVVRGTRQ